MLKFFCLITNFNLFDILKFSAQYDLFSYEEFLFIFVYI